MIKIRNSDQMYVNIAFGCSKWKLLDVKMTEFFKKPENNYIEFNSICIVNVTCHFIKCNGKSLKEKIQLFFRLVLNQ